MADKSAYYRALDAVELVFEAHGAPAGTEVAKALAAQTAIALFSRTSALDMASDQVSYDQLVAAKLRVLPDDEPDDFDPLDITNSVVPVKTKPTLAAMLKLQKAELEAIRSALAEANTVIEPTTDAF